MCQAKYISCWKFNTAHHIEINLELPGIRNNRTLVERSIDKLVVQFTGQWTKECVTPVERSIDKSAVQFTGRWTKE